MSKPQKCLGPPPHPKNSLRGPKKAQNDPKKAKNRKSINKKYYKMKVISLYE